MTCIEMASGGMMYMPVACRSVQAFQECRGGDTNRAKNFINVLSFKNGESRPEIKALNLK